ncbi:transposase [Staphylococcus gallinarum]|uniref:Transposase n=2 Tax=Staphylococcus gallinarum TaxID=1293 RepID=A0A3A0VHN9_STAGA|nr:transposase [Staphylococcus gallinarum]
MNSTIFMVHFLIILYAYCQSIFSGRRIERALTDSIRMMWLSQNQTPSYRTINLLENLKSLYNELIETEIITKIKQEMNNELSDEDLNKITNHLSTQI